MTTFNELNDTTFLIQERWLFLLSLASFYSSFLLNMQGIYDMTTTLAGCGQIWMLGTLSFDGFHLLFLFFIIYGGHIWTTQNKNGKKDCLMRIYDVHDFLLSFLVLHSSSWSTQDANSDFTIQTMATLHCDDYMINIRDENGVWRLLFFKRFNCW